MYPFHAQKQNFGFEGATIRIEEFNEEKGAFDYYTLTQKDQTHLFNNLDRSWLFCGPKVNFIFSSYIKKHKV